MFWALISPPSGVSQAVFYIQPFGSCGVYVSHLRVPVDWFVVVVSLYSVGNLIAIRTEDARYEQPEIRDYVVSECDGMIGKRDTRDISKCRDTYVQGMTKLAANWGMQCYNLDPNEMCNAVFNLLCKQYVL